MTRERRTRIRFTPIKLLVGAATVVGAFTITFAVTLMIDAEPIGVTTLSDGARRFTLQRLDDAIVPPVFINSLYLLFGVLFYLFRRRLVLERTGSVAGDVQRFQNSHTSIRMVGYALVTVLALAFVALWVFTTIVLPYKRIRAITVGADGIKCESLYATWMLSKDDIASVDKRKEVNTRSGGHAYSLIITTRDGRTLRSGEMLHNPEPGTDADRETDKLFSDVASTLRGV